jgi:hypothetical protein
MNSRYDLNELFVSIMGTRNVYFQPPATLKMKYPCIRYSLEKINFLDANDERYSRFDRFSVILIDTDIDSIFVDKILKLPYCEFVRFYSSDNLNHWVFTIYTNHY